MIEKHEGAAFGIVSLGGCDPAVREAVTLFEKKGIRADYMRVRGFPFDQSVEDFLMSHPFNYVVEQNRDGQLRTLLLTETAVPKERLQSVLVYGGFPLSARHVVDGILAQENARNPAGASPAGTAARRQETGACVVTKKPAISHPSLRPNALGLTLRDYEGAMSTLCAGCGHDSVTAAIVRAFYDLELPPHMIAKLSGIGCSSKTPTYFVSGAHGFNSAHGRMPAIATGAAAANRAAELHRHLGRRRFACRSASASCRTRSAAT